MIDVEEDETMSHLVGRRANILGAMAGLREELGKVEDALAAWVRVLNNEEARKDG